MINRIAFGSDNDKKESFKYGGMFLKVCLLQYVVAITLGVYGCRDPTDFQEEKKVNIRIAAEYRS